MPYRIGALFEVSQSNKIRCICAGVSFSAMRIDKNRNNGESEKDINNYKPFGLLLWGLRNDYKSDSWFALIAKGTECHIW
jgi:hypothetical protein